MKNKPSGSAAIVLGILLFLFTAPPYYAQEIQTEADETREMPAGEEQPDEINEETGISKTDAPLSAEKKRIDMEIKTSTLPELAALCRSLGLSEAGNAVTLRARLSEYFGIALSPEGTENQKKQKTITIESARSTEYFTIEAVDEDYARLTGDVQVTLRDGDATHKIRAWEILFNRSRNIITASGGVEYIKEDGDKKETFRGDSITVNIDNWSSVFLGGISERSLQGDNASTYLFSGTVISRDEEEVTVLSKASISSAKSEESLWSLDASRVWLLPGSDFAILNALLKVGEIPVLYIPFFYYPADEVIFHPVIGYKTREGNFVQTTTYILGRPKASSASESSLTRILGNSNDMEKTREGLFLRSTGKKVQDQNKTSFRVMFDYYANLGGYLGSDLVTPNYGILNQINLNLGIGITRTIFETGTGFTPFAPNYDGTSDWNRSKFLSMEVPFRYHFNMNSGVSGKYGSFSWDIPYYSDPFMERDFQTRSESMDWVNMIQKGAAIEEEVTTSSSVSSYTWQFRGNLNPKFPNMSPYISNISINTITSAIPFKAIDNRNDPSYKPNDPRRFSPSSFFFIPDTTTLFSLGGSISGTPVNLGGQRNTGSNAAVEAQGDANPFEDFGMLRSPWESEKTENGRKTDSTDDLVPPALSQRFNLGSGGGAQFSVAYSFSPTGASDMQFNSSQWKNYEDIDWGDITAVRSTVSGSGNVTLNMNHSGGLYTNAFSFSGNGTYREYSYLNEEAEDFLTSGKTDPDKIKRVKEQMYRQTLFGTTFGLSSSTRPLYQNGIWGQSNLSYRLSGLAVRSNFIGDGDNPEWEMQYGEWDKDKIDSHQFSTNVTAAIMEKNQSITFRADLPPKNPTIYTDAAFRVWITETRASFSVLNPGEADIRKLNPFNFTETFSFGTTGSLAYNMVLDSETREFTRISSNLSLTTLGLSAAYTAIRMTGSTLGPAGWVSNTGDESLKSNDFSVDFNKSFARRNLMDGKLEYSLNVSSRLFFDLQRYTRSGFNLTLGYGMKITNFLDLNMSVTSENAVIYRYYRSLLPDLPPDVRNAKGEQYDLFQDLLNSFRFDDENRRRSSGFKMKRFNLRLTHYLGDWDAVLEIAMAPYLLPGTRQYKLNTDMSFLVKWIPISEIKTDMKYYEKDDRWIVQ